MKAIHGLFAMAVTAGLASIGAAQVTGTVKLEGDAPEAEMIDMSGVAECNALHADPVADATVVAGENGELANVIVSISQEAHPELTGDVPAEPAVLDQAGCMYVPHVLAMMAGQKLVVKNDDPFLHNVHALPEQNPQFNFGQPNKDPGKDVGTDAPKVPETFRVKCDVHPWMSAYIGVFPHPYFSVTGEDGAFSIANIPDGEYSFVAWHEKYGQSEPQTVQVTGGKGEVSFTFDAAAQANPRQMPTADVQLASDNSQNPECPIMTGGCCDPKAAPAASVKAQEPAQESAEPQAAAR